MPEVRILQLHSAIEIVCVNLWWRVVLHIYEDLRSKETRRDPLTSGHV